MAEFEQVPCTGDGTWVQSRKTVVFVTHDVVEAVELSDRIIVLQPGGRIFEDIPIDLPRPRRQSDPAVAMLQAEVLARLERMTATPTAPARSM